MQVSHFKKSLPVIVIVFMFCGCAYLKERLLDLADCVDVGIGVGAGVGVDINVTPHVGLGIGGGLAGFAAKWGRNFGTADYGFILVPFFGLVAGRARGLEEEIGDKWGTDYGFTNFKSYVRDGEKEKDYWNDAYFKDKIPKNCSKIYLAGDLKFLNSVTEALLKCGIPKAKLIYI